MAEKQESQLQQTVRLGDGDDVWYAKMYWGVEEDGTLFDAMFALVRDVEDTDPKLLCEIGRDGSCSLVMDVTVQTGRQLTTVLGSIESARMLIRDAMGVSASPSERIDEHRGAPMIVVVSR